MKPFQIITTATISPCDWTDEQIATAIKQAHSTGLHEHADCIRMSGEWLAAQQRTARPAYGGHRPLKHIIEGWCQRYVSSSDVEVAAHMLGLLGRYPDFNITKALTLPHPVRLEGISQAGAHSNYRNEGHSYKRTELECVAVTALQTNC